jgi:adenosylhomocysteinase
MPELPLTGVSKKLHYPLRIFAIHPPLEEVGVFLQKIDKNVRNFVDEYVLKDGRKLYLLAEGRLVNLGAAEGHPANVMDMSFATQALASEYVLKNKDKLDKKVYVLPKEIEDEISYTKLDTMGISIDKLTDEQIAYLESWEMGTI